MNPSTIDAIAALGTQLNVLRLQTVGDYREYTSALKRPDIDAIASLCNSFADEPGRTELSEWITEADAETCQTVTYRTIWYVLLLIEILEGAGTLSMTGGPISRFGPEEAFDWTKLPPDLYYVVEPASKYGRIQFGDQIDVFERLKTGVETRELQAIARRTEDDIHDIMGWVRQMDEASRANRQSDPEVSRLHFFLTLLHELGYS